MIPVHVHASVAATAFVVAVATSGCSMTLPSLPGASAPPAEPPPQASLPPGFAPEEIVGRWGLAAYHKETDRARTETAARGQCKQAYAIGRGATGGVMMHQADSTQPEELRLKGGPGGKTYIGPEGGAGGARDREVVSFDGRVLVLRWIDPEVQGRYGTAIYVRCGPRA